MTTEVGSQISNMSKGGYDFNIHNVRRIVIFYERICISKTKRHLETNSI